jgi:hypothetical protein
MKASATEPPSADAEELAIEATGGIDGFVMRSS